jgi:enoyl-CoA hydratase/carnithine racemase
MSGEIAVNRRDGVQIIRISRPDKKNALHGGMYDAMSAALDAGDKDEDIACHVFLGSEVVFTAGNDMNDFMRRSSMSAEKLDTRPPSTEFIRRLPKVAKPMIAAVDGLAVGIGTTLLLHCDMVFASPTAALRAPFVNLGICQEAGSSLTGPERLGHQAAFELLILGETWSAERAYVAGLVNAIVPAAELEAKALATARKMAGMPREALFAARKLMKGDVGRISRMIEAEVEVLHGLVRSGEAREAFAAFLEKRQPDFAKARASARKTG